ncbi:MAG: hypothetical protein LKE96_00170 [Acetobacter peroxydans]|nr:hypothetical protein [Acetobacter peroxydans]
MRERPEPVTVAMEPAMCAQAGGQALRVMTVLSSHERFAPDECGAIGLLVRRLALSGEVVVGHTSPYGTFYGCDVQAGAAGLFMAWRPCALQERRGPACPRGSP